MDRWWRAALAGAVVVAVVTAAVVAFGGLPDRRASIGDASAVIETGPTGAVGSGAITPSGTSSATGSETATASATGTGRSSSASTAARSSATSAVPGTASLAGQMRPGVVRTGVATFYDTDGSGACSYDPGADVMTAAMNWKDYEGSKACGAAVEVTGSTGVRITVRITNECPSPCRVGQLDLSPQAYQKLAPLKTGQTPITWKLVSAPVTGGMSVRYKTGSSQWWCGIQAVDHRNPVARLEVKVNGAWKALPRATYNYFLSADGAGCGGPVRVTDIYGQSLVTGSLPVRPNVLQPTTFQFARH